MLSRILRLGLSGAILLGLAVPRSARADGEELRPLALEDALRILALPARIPADLDDSGRFVAFCLENCRSCRPRATTQTAAARALRSSVARPGRSRSAPRERIPPGPRSTGGESSISCAAIPRPQR